MNQAFRKKTFKGAKIEDTIANIEMQLELISQKEDTEYYKGLRDGLAQTRLQLIQAFKYNTK